MIAGLIRRLRWRASRWSADDDREFHDALFSPQQYDPFTFAYPGYVTIRRFADLASAHLTDVRRAAELGCGPGEITCDLARRLYAGGGHGRRRRDMFSAAGAPLLRRSMRSVE